MFWVILLSVLGAALAFGLFLVVMGHMISARRCPASQFATAATVRIATRIPVPRSVATTDPERICTLASFLSDDAEPSMEAACPTVTLAFHMPGGRVHQIEASVAGWNWRHDRPHPRRLTDAGAFMRLMDELLPVATEDDLAAIVMEEEDLSAFDELQVPEDLRDLAPLARKWGRGDDLIRGEMVRRAAPEERRDLVARVSPRTPRILEYIESFGLPSVEDPLPEECVRIMYMWEAAEEAASYDDMR